MDRLDDLAARRAAATAPGLTVNGAHDPLDACADVAVIGAGWAGLAAAVELAAAGRRVTLVDAAPAPGGRARAVRVAFDGVEARLDNGQHLLIGAYRECLRLVAIVGSGAADAPPSAPTLVRAPLRLLATDGLDLRAASLPPPLHLLGGLLSARGLSLRERWAIARMMAALRRQGWQVRPGETVDALLRRLRQPESLRRRVWAPLAVAALNTPAESACARTFAVVLRDALGADARAADFVLPADTLSDVLPDPACRWLERHGARLHWRTAVRALTPDGACWRIETDRGALQAAGVVLAVPPPAAVRLLAPAVCTPAQRTVLRALEAFRYESLATVYLGWPGDRGARLPRWIMLDESAGPTAYGQWLFDRGLHAGLRIAAVVVSARGRLPEVGPDALADGIAHQVAAQLRLPAPLVSRTIVEKRATFRCVPDRPRLTADAMARADAQARSAPPRDGGQSRADDGVSRSDGDTDACFRRLFLAGDYAWPDYPATLEAAVRSGVEAARGLAATLP